MGAGGSFPMDDIIKDNLIKTIQWACLQAAEATWRLRPGPPGRDVVSVVRMEDHRPRFSCEPRGCLALQLERGGKLHEARELRTPPPGTAMTAVFFDDEGGVSVFHAPAVAGG